MHSIRQAWHAVVLAGLGALLLLDPAPAAAATSEAQVKAAYIYKLASFVRWPDGSGASDQFRICISGRRDVAAVVQELVRGQRVDNQPVTVLRLDDDPEQAKSCRVLFVGHGGHASTKLLAGTEELPVLTICDRSNGTRGCVIEFVMRDGKVRFALDRARADRRRLELSAKLVDVAVRAP
ncbi:MAG TPA: YfiR family protein [Croceibacterium sp.]|nr:YfiR family protein [Croceibacterium sp.]